MSSKAARKTWETPLEDWDAGEGHPSHETLRAYQKGALSEAEEERLQDHFVLCPECAQTLLDLNAFFDAAPVAGRQDPERLTQAWDDLVKTLDRDRR